MKEGDRILALRRCLWQAHALLGDLYTSGSISEEREQEAWSLHEHIAEVLIEDQPVTPEPSGLVVS